MRIIELKVKGYSKINKGWYVSSKVALVGEWLCCFRVPKPGRNYGRFLPRKVAEWLHGLMLMFCYFF